MDDTAGPILEIGVVLLAAVVAGWLARRLGLPALVGYLALGVVVSPFTPGYVADREQLLIVVTKVAVARGCSPAPPTSRLVASSSRSASAR